MPLFDVKKLVVEQIKKQDADKDGIPDVIEALDAAEAAAENIAKFASRFAQADYLLALEALNKLIGGKLSSDEVNDAARSLAALPAALAALKKSLDAIEKEIK